MKLNERPGRRNARFASLFSYAPRYYSSGVDRGVRPFSLFVTTALVLLASSLARTGQRPYLSLTLSCFPSLSVPRYLPTYLSPFLCLFLAFCPSFTLLSLSLNKLYSSTRFPLIRRNLALNSHEPARTCTNL